MAHVVVFNISPASSRRLEAQLWAPRCRDTLCRVLWQGAGAKIPISLGAAQVCVQTPPGVRGLRVSLERN